MLNLKKPKKQKVLAELDFRKVKKAIGKADLSHIEDVYLHIGMHKTATSFIQLSLYKNAERLLNSGYF